MKFESPEITKISFETENVAASGNSETFIPGIDISNGSTAEM